MDASIIIENVNFVDDIVKILEGEPNMVVFSHPHRNKVIDEIAVLKKMGKFRDQDFEKQYKAYLQEGFKDDYGLFAFGFFIRKMHDEIINKLFDDWFSEIIKFTIRDQVSFPYVLWKNKEMKPDVIIKENIFNNKLVGKVMRHL